MVREIPSSAGVVGEEKPVELAVSVENGVRSLLLAFSFIHFHSGDQSNFVCLLTSTPFSGCWAVRVFSSLRKFASILSGAALV